MFSLLPPHQEEFNVLTVSNMVLPDEPKQVFQGLFTEGGTDPTPRALFFINAYYVKHESHSPLRNPAQPSSASSQVAI